MTTAPVVERRRLGEGKVDPGASGRPFRRFFAFLGPAYLVSVGYMDPGNWATDLEGGARFGYALLWVLLLSNAMAVVLQTLAARLGVVTGHDLAQACRAEYSRPVNFVLWLLAEVAIAACDLAEVVGTVIALKLLFGIPLLWGCVATALDTFLLLALQRFGVRRLEAVILALVATIGACFLVEMIFARPDLGAVVAGLRPSLPPGSEFVAIGILGATVMPHNLYLHSALVQTRRIGPDEASRRQACRYNLIDSVVALNAAFFVNAAILVLSGAAFFGGVAVTGIEQAYELLPSLHRAAPILFGVALLCAGQSSTLTGTLAGQIIMEGYLDLKLAPWLRRLVTRSIALVPAVLTIALAGEQATQRLLVLSQVILSLQLSFAVIPLIQFTSNRRNMGSFATPWWGRLLAWTSAAIIAYLNARLVLMQAAEWVGALRESGARLGPIRLDLVAAAGLYGTIGAAALLLGGILLKPWVRPARPWAEQPEPVEVDWSTAIQPRTVDRLALALERGAGDAEIVSRALALAEAGATHLVLLHVVDSPLTGVYGSATLDQEAGADRRYLDEVARELAARGFSVSSVLLHGPNRARELVTHLQAEPVDLLVVGSHGHGPVRDLIYGETVGPVRHNLAIPILIARPPV